VEDRGTVVAVVGLVVTCQAQPP